MPHTGLERLNALTRRIYERHINQLVDALEGTYTAAEIDAFFAGDLDPFAEAAITAELASRDLVDATGVLLGKMPQVGADGVEWVDPPGVILPSLLLPLDGDLDGQAATGAVTATGVGALRFVDGATPGTEAVFTEAGTTQLVRNPYFAVDTTWWANGGGTISRDTGRSWAGPASGKITPDGTSGHAYVSIVHTFDSGVDHTLTAVVYQETGADQLLNIRQGGGTFIVSTPVPSGVWTTVTGTLTGNGTSTSYRIGPGGTPAAGDTMWLGYVGVEVGSDATTPCPAIDASGDLLPGHAWTGTPHASASTRTGSGVTLPFPDVDADACAMATRVSIDADTGADQPIFNASGDTSNWYTLVYREGTLRFIAGTAEIIASTLPVSTGAWHDIAFRKSGDSVTFGVDGTYETVTGVPTGMTLATDLQIGYRTVGATPRYLHGAVGPVAWFGADVTTDELDALRGQDAWTWAGLRDTSGLVSRAAFAVEHESDGTLRNVARPNAPYLSLNSAIPGEREHPSVTKPLDAPILAFADQPAASMLWPWLADRRPMGGSGVSLFWSTDHDAGLGGIYAAEASGPEGAFTARGAVVYQDTTVGGQTETPSVVWDAPNDRYNLYYQNSGAGAFGNQATLLATSTDLVTFSRVGVVLDKADSIDAGDGHCGYFRPFRLGGSWYGYSLYGGTANWNGAFWQSADGAAWTAHPARLGHDTPYIDHLAGFASDWVIKWHGATVIQWRGAPWLITVAGSENAGGADPAYRVVTAPLTPDYTHLAARVTDITPDAQAWEGGGIGQIGNALLWGGTLYIPYRSALDNGGIGLMEVR